MKKAFADGYNQFADEPLPKDWYILAKLLDVESMLMMLNRDSVPDGWGEDVSDEIDATLDLV